MRSPTLGAAAAVFALALAATSCAGGTDTVAATTGSAAIDVAAPATTAPVPTAVEENGSAQDRAPALDAEVAPTQAAETGTEAEPTATAKPSAPEPVAAATVRLPTVDVVELSTGQTSDLAGFARPGATLVWFWAP
ncbi:MAG: hypothetical protein ACI88C_002709, partial [Acidimicrobiales bacterium]